LRVNYLNYSGVKKYRHFLLHGNELILKQNIADTILESLKADGFNEKILLNQDQLDQAEEIIMRNISGSLFQEKLILHLRHSAGKFPDKIKAMLENHYLYESEHIGLIIESSSEKIPASGQWIKNIDDRGLIVDCKKLKTVEEKIWLKRQLEFLPKNLLPKFGGSIFQNNEGNLLGQMNEVRLLKLLFTNEESIEESDRANIIFHSGLSAFELEDVIIDQDFKKALRTIGFLREHDRQNSAPLIWVIAKVINSCLESLQSANPKAALIKSGVWSSKISQYLNLIQHAASEDFERLSEEMLRLDLANKGMVNVDIWEQIERIILQLRDAAQPHH